MEDRFFPAKKVAAYERDRDGRILCFNCALCADPRVNESQVGQALGGDSPFVSVFLKFVTWFITCTLPLPQQVFRGRKGIYAGSRARQCSTSLRVRLKLIPGALPRYASTS